MNDALALAALKRCRVNIRAAAIDAADGADRLSGVRAARAAELAETLSDCVCFVERLIFVVTADHNYVEATMKACERQADSQHKGDSTP